MNGELLHASHGLSFSPKEIFMVMRKHFLKYCFIISIETDLKERQVMVKMTVVWSTTEPDIMQNDSCIRFLS